MQKKVNGLFVIAACFFLFTNCDSKAVFDTYKTTPNQWHRDSVASFTFSAPDTISNYNLYINLRSTNAYKFSNLFLLVELNYPNGKTVKDTLEYKMAAPNGELLGTGFSDIKENKLWYKGFNTPFRFQETGDYSINISHAMRNNGDVNGLINLEGITEVGFRIEHTLQD
ncbi:MAG: gliding motility lipoprotein GldH [Winogradskyella sp.]